MTRFPIPETDEELLTQCDVHTFRAGGKGGQHQNVTESGVRLVHGPTGLRATAREERSQHRNRVLALRRLRAKLEQFGQEATPRIPTAIPKGERRRRLDQKRRKGQVKSLRRPPEPDEQG